MKPPSSQFGFPTTPNNCVMVLEAKGLGEPLAARVSQPQRYVDAAALGSVRYVLTTDGPTLFLYEWTADGWTPEPVGRLDVASIQRSYLLPEGT
jgi:hypothetical protein